MPTKGEATKEAIFIALGQVSALFMSQDTKGTEIIMPSEELEKIGTKLSNDIYSIWN